MKGERVEVSWWVVGIRRSYPRNIRTILRKIGPRKERVERRREEGDDDDKMGVGDR